MPKLSPISAKKFIKIVKKLGFVKIRQRGSHVRLVHADGRKITIPVHSGENVRKGLLRKIIKDLQISVDEFNKLR